jgi:hypothetical protein
MEDAAVAQAKREHENSTIDPSTEIQASRPDWVIGLDVQVVDFLSGDTVAAVLEGFTTEVTVSVAEFNPGTPHGNGSVRLVRL